MSETVELDTAAIVLIDYGLWRLRADEVSDGIIALLSTSDRLLRRGDLSSVFQGLHYIHRATEALRMTVNWVSMKPTVLRAALELVVRAQSTLSRFPSCAAVYRSTARERAREFEPRTPVLDLDAGASLGSLWSRSIALKQWCAAAERNSRLVASILEAPGDWKTMESKLESLVSSNELDYSDMGQYLWTRIPRALASAKSALILSAIAIQLQLGYGRPSPDLPLCPYSLTQLHFDSGRRLLWSDGDNQLNDAGAYVVAGDSYGTSTRGDIVWELAPRSTPRGRHAESDSLHR